MLGVKGWRFDDGNGKRWCWLIIIWMTIIIITRDKRIWRNKTKACLLFLDSSQRVEFHSLCLSCRWNSLISFCQDHQNCFVAKTSLMDDWYSTMISSSCWWWLWCFCSWLCFCKRWWWWKEMQLMLLLLCSFLFFSLWRWFKSEDEAVDP